MEKRSIFIIALTIITLMATLFFLCPKEENTEYLRIHIRANSNLEVDQSVKYKVKDEIVNFLTPKVSECDSKEKAEKMLKSNLKNIESVANKTLIANGFNYTAKAKINSEMFPTRVYNDLTLGSGYYDALIIELGSGSGDNWWCVVYPPLCFTGSGSNYIYKSKIYEIIKNFKEKQ